MDCPPSSCLILWLILGFLRFVLGPIGIGAIAQRYSLWVMASVKRVQQGGSSHPLSRVGLLPTS
ncbi:MAG: hypothetical protein ACO331_00735 [Prochlorothrix sp.]